MTWSQNSSGMWVFVNDGTGYANDPLHRPLPNPQKLADPPVANATPSSGPKLDPTGETPNPNLDVIPKGTILDWTKFLDGSFVPNSGGTEGAIAGEPYVSGAPLADGRANSKSIILLPSIDGKGFVAQDLDAAIQEYTSRILPNDRINYKLQLKDFYKSDDEFAVSIEGGPEFENDLGFQKAIKKAIQSLSYDNFYIGVQVANELKTNPTFDPTGKLNDFRTWVMLRRPLPSKTSESSRVSQLTTKKDALKEFYRTVQEYVGDPTLVNELDKLANQYWLDLQAEELTRGSTTFSTTNITQTKKTSTGQSFAQLSDVDRLEMRIKLITKGSTKAKSTGIKNVEPIKLQDAGGKIGNYYTDLTEYSYKTGIKLSPETLLSKVSEMNNPGGSLEEQKRTLMQASKLKYKALAPYIDAGIMPGDFIADLAAIKAKELDLNAGQINIFDEDIQKGITGDTLLGPEDFTNLVRKNPNWRYGSTANNLAAQFINSISTTFGKLG